MSEDPRPGPVREGVVVRTATRADVEAITEIYNQAVVHTTASYDLEPVSLASRLAWFDEKIAEGWPVLVATSPSGDEIVGWSSYGPYRAKAGYDATVEHSVYVRTDRRAGGVGTALLLPLIDRARAEGRHVMLGGVDADNAGSIAFHERHGFTAVARFHQVGRKFDRWLDLVFLQLLLSDDSKDPDDSDEGRPAS